MVAGGCMRVWMPESIYRFFPFLVGAIGLAGCLTGTAVSLGLGGTLLLYSGGVFCMRWQYRTC